MARRLVIVCIELLVVLMVAVSGTLLWASYYIDTEEFRSLFTETLSGAIGREVQLVGDLNINLWPKILLEVDELAVADDPAFGTEPFAHFDTIHINVRVLPLLAKRITIESVFVDGLTVSLISDENGRFNLESMLEPSGDLPDQGIPPAMEGWDFSLSNVEVVNTEILFHDNAADRNLRLSGIRLRTGEIEAGTPVPVTVGSEFSWKKQGIKSDFSLTGLVRFNQDMTNIHLSDATLTANVFGDFLPEGAVPGQLTSRVSFDWDRRAVALDNIQAQLLGIRAEGNIKSGDLSKTLRAEGHVAIHPFAPAGLISRFAPEVPIQSVDGLKSCAFASFFSIDPSGVRFTELVAGLDDVTVRGELGFTGFTSPVFDFNLRGNTIDLDRYLPLFRTGTPFIWDDFNLPLFAKFKGEGNIRADGFKVVDTLLSDIRLKLFADTSILIDAGAIKEGQASLGGSMELIIGEDAMTHVPTFSMKTRIDAESQNDGFAFLKGQRGWAGGVGTIALAAEVATMACPPEARSLGIVDYLTANVALGLLNGVAGFTTESGEVKEHSYTNADVSVAVTPGSGPAGYWNANISASLQTKGGSDIEALSVDVQGPVSVAWDEFHVMTSGMSVNGGGALGVLPKAAKRAHVSAKVAYDSKAHVADVESLFVQVLETTLTGSANVTGLDGDTKGSGEFAIKGANSKRIIYLLTGKNYKTKDPEALKSASIAARFEAEKSGFTLKDVVADIDGLPVTGYIVGNGYVHPMLAFSLSGGFLDIDRYIPPSTEMTLEQKRAGKYVKAPSVRLPMEFLGWLRLNGKVALEGLKLTKIRASGVTGDIRADNGLIHVARVVGTAYEGALTADWKGEIGREFLTTRLMLHVEDMLAGPLMKDLGDREYVRGVTDVDIDVDSKGATDDDIVSNLSGKVWARVTNGSFKFSGYPTEGEIRPGTLSKQELAKEAQRAKARTMFQKAVGEFTVVNGVFTADKFRVEAPPVLQSYGEGGFSLPDNTIDLSIRNDFVAVPSVTMELTGRLTDPKVNIPTGKILPDTVLNILSLPKKSLDFLRDLF